MQIIKELNKMKTVVLFENKHYLISQVENTFVGLETLIFKCDKNGNVLDWVDVGGSRDVSRDEVLNNFLSYIYDRNSL